MDPYTQLFGSAALMVAGAYGVWRRRGTAASLYLDARVWWKRNVATRALRAEESSYDSRVTRIADGGSADARVVALQDDRSGQMLHGWRSPDGVEFLAVGNDAPAPFPASDAEIAEFQRAECPFVLVTYVNSAGSECRLDVDPALWYRRGGMGVPKFTQAEVRYLHSRAAGAVDWTNEYTVECMTADGREVALTQDQVFWSGPRAKPVAAVETTPNEAHAPVAAASDAAATDVDDAAHTAAATTSFEQEEEEEDDAFMQQQEDEVAEEVVAEVTSPSSSAGRRRRSDDEDGDIRDRKKRRRQTAEYGIDLDAQVAACVDNNDTASSSSDDDDDE
jgi:hypothetical protein